MDSDQRHWMNAMPAALLWAVFLSVVVLIVVLLITEKPLHYEGYLQFGGNAAALAGGAADNYDVAGSGAGTLEWNEADKTFFPSVDCPEAALRPAINKDNSGKLQASICACLDAEAGRGWYCWN